MRTLLAGLGGLVLLSIATLGPAHAEDSVPLRVGRVSLAETGASWRPAGGDWSGAVVNLPVATGTSLRTGASGGAEFRLGDAIVALDRGSETDLARLDPHIVKLAVSHGRIAIALRTVDDGESIEIDLPNGVVRLLQPGRYDIAAGSETAPARVAVFDGRAEFSGGGDDTTIASGTTARLGKAAPIAVGFEAAPDAFDQNLETRAAAAEESTASRIHLSPELAGAAELDRNGEWRAVEGYGAAWFPSGTPEGWAPYRDGSWRWISPWGWTWIDNASWGFAPSHYGRWVQMDGHWAWVPGKPVAEPAYAPAVVAFLGTPGVGLSYADAFSPAVAWFPLAPGEVYWPGFSRDAAVIRRLNEGQVDDAATIRLADNGGPPPAIVTAEYRNRRFATAVPRTAFLAGRPVASRQLPIPERRLDSAPLILAMPFPPAPQPVAVAAAAPAKPVATAAAAPVSRSVVIAAARAAVPALAAAHNRAGVVVRRTAPPLRLAVRHAVLRAHAAHAAGHLRVLASLSGGHAGHSGRRHVAALHGRAR